LTACAYKHYICVPRYRLTKHGGHGYEYILKEIVPQMRRVGITEEQIDAILVRNDPSLTASRCRS